MKNKYLTIIAVFLFMLIGGELMAQCSMCKAVVESNADAGGELGGGINNAILYLMGVPYLLIGTVGFFVYKNYKKK